MTQSIQRSNHRSALRNQHDWLSMTLGFLAHRGTENIIIIIPHLTKHTPHNSNPVVKTGGNDNRLETEEKEPCVLRSWRL